MINEVTGALAMVISTAVLTGIVTAIGTVAAVRVHITYMRESIAAAFRRIENLEQHKMNSAAAHKRTHGEDGHK